MSFALFFSLLLVSNQKGTSARVVHVGAGIDLGTDRPDEVWAQAAVKVLLENETCRPNTRKVRIDLNAQGGRGPPRVCGLLEEAASASRVGNVERVKKYYSRNLPCGFPQSVGNLHVLIEYLIYVLGLGTIQSSWPVRPTC